MMSAIAITPPVGAQAPFLKPLPAAHSQGLGSGRGPEVVPDYCPTESLRDDATLRAISANGDELVLAVGDHGTILRSDDGGYKWSSVEIDVASRLSDVAWIDDKQAIAVGGHYDPITRMSRSRVLLSRDAGRSWRIVDSNELPRLRSLVLWDGRLVACGDWSSIHRSSMYESVDAGLNWQSLDPRDHARVQSLIQRRADAEIESASDLARWSQAIGVPIASRCFCRLGEKTVLVAGDHGVIARSDDLGRQWMTVRGTQRRTAILFVSTNAHRVPWSLLGRETIEHRRRSSILMLDADDASESLSMKSELPQSALQQTSLPLASPNGMKRDWLEQAAMGAVASGVDVLRTPSNDQTQKSEIQNWLLIHRPSVIALDDQLDDLTQQRFLAAAMSVGAERVVTYSIGHMGNSLLLSSATLPQSGTLAGDFWQDALLLVEPTQMAPTTTSTRTLYESTGNTTRVETLGAGIQLEPGQNLTAGHSPTARRRMQVVLARQRNTVKLDEMIRDAVEPRMMKTALQLALDQTAPEDRFRLAWYVVQSTQQRVGVAGESVDDEIRDVAAQVFQDYFPNSSAAAWLRTWLTATHQSCERSQRIRQPAAVSSQRPFVAMGEPQSKTSEAGDVVDSALELPSTSGVDVAGVSPFQDSSSMVVQASAVSPIQVPHATAMNTAKSMRPNASADVDLMWEMHPLKLLIEHAEKIATGNRLDSSENHASTANLDAVARSNSRWSPLLTRDGTFSLLAKQSVSGPPRLDGQYDDPCWQAASPIQIGDVELRCTHDQRFVYFAVQVPADKLGSDRSTMPAGQRDCDLDASDRVRLRLDLDQDLLTSMQLEFNTRGKTRDGIEHPADWQPTWFIAPKQNGSHVQFEIAVTRADLVGTSTKPLKTWFFSAEVLAAGEASPWQIIPLPEQWVRVDFQ
ncbi:hypothetical protein [Stieleria varia]|nr:hypothetical protein [Stieleria varia]